jgi:hypothetical protein
MQDTTTLETDNQKPDADNIRYQILLTSEEAACKLRNSVAGISGMPLKEKGPGEESQIRRPM